MCLKAHIAAKQRSDILCITPISPFSLARFLSLSLSLTSYLHACSVSTLSSLLSVSLFSPTLGSFLYPSVIMSLCALVVEKVSIRGNGKIHQRIGRIIIGFEEPDKETVNFISKYVHYPSCDFVHNEFSFLYNGIDAITLSTQGEKYSAVVDWLRAAIRFRKVVVCGKTHVIDIVGSTPCEIIDLQDFYYTQRNHRIQEPFSLARLAFKFFEDLYL